MPQKTITIDLSKYPADTRILDIVSEALKLSKSQVRGLFDVDGVQLDGRFCAQAGVLRGQSKSLSLTFIPGKHYKAFGHGWEKRPFHICYEDPHIIVVEKHAGILSVPTEDGKGRSLLGELKAYLRQNTGSAGQLIAVHRLDRDTSGLLVFAKSQAIADILIQQFKEQKPERLYLALVSGIVAQDKGTFESRFIMDQYLNQMSSRTGEKGLLAITDFQVLKRLGDITLVEARLRTGRRNQIRVHFSEAGHPILGDSRYQTEKAQHPLWPHKRLALHASSLAFTHPHNNRPLAFTSPIPLEMQRCATL